MDDLSEPSLPPSDVKRTPPSTRTVPAVTHLDSPYPSRDRQGRYPLCHTRPSPEVFT